MWSDESSFSKWARACVVFSKRVVQVWICLCYAIGAFCYHGLGPPAPLEGRVTANQYKHILSDRFYPVMKYFYPDARGLFEDDIVPIHRAWGVTVWFESYINHMLWPSQWSHLNPVKHLKETLPSLKQVRGIKSKDIKAVLAACGGLTLH